MSAIELLPEDVVVIPEIPAIPAETYPLMWISEILIRTHGPEDIGIGSGYACIQYYPMTQDGVVRRTDTSGKSLMKSIETGNLYADMGLIPSLQSAFSNVLDSIIPVQRLKAAQAALRTAQTSLADAQASGDELRIESAQAITDASQTALNELVASL